jgi:hypothetical protein
MSQSVYLTNEKQSFTAEKQSFPATGAILGHCEFHAPREFTVFLQPDLLPPLGML